MPQLFELSEDKRNLALKRFKVIEPYINGRDTLSNIARQHSVSQSSLTRWVAKYKNHGLSGLARKQRKDRGTRKISDLLFHGIEALVLHRPHLSAAAIHRQISKFAKSNGEYTPSYSFVRNYIANIPDDLKTLAHHGNKKYDDLYELIFIRNAERSNKIWQADHTQLDIIVLDENDNERRPWLTIILDDKSRAVAGYYLTFAAPSALNTSLALRQAIWRKQDPNWPVCGIPEILYTDHGSDFTSRHIEQVCAELKIELIFSSVGKPRGRGKIERFFETINQMLLIDLPGYPKCKSKPQNLLSKDLLETRIRDFLNDYHHKKHPALNKNPIESWEENGFLPRLPDSYEQLDLLLLTVVKPRKVRNVGISFSGLNYQSPVLAAYVGEPVVIRYDPRDISEIRVFHDDKYLCSAICPELSERSVSLDQLKKARIKRKAELRKIIRQRKSLVDQILEKPAPPIIAKKKPLRGKQTQNKPQLKIYENE
ncbi:MAG: DDE-type integrase/transposase/recombinase [Proteobacteria bacterium]|nr:DDE-type integrase/transposase/recombinase [Pseudomonadota bacterium]MBU0966242.1 DDE-type integrase/transposase/recombinase [Pseudomonadota bacterium]